MWSGGRPLVTTWHGRQIARIERGSVFSKPVRYPTSKRFPVPAVETDMRDGFDTDKAILALKRAMEATLDDGRWQELGYLLGKAVVVQEHPRLLRSLFLVQFRAHPGLRRSRIGGLIVCFYNVWLAGVSPPATLGGTQ